MRLSCDVALDVTLGQIILCCRLAALSTNTTKQLREEI